MQQTHAGRFLVPVFLTLLLLTSCRADRTSQPSELRKEAVTIPARDGVLLATDLYFPSDSTGAWPVILVRTPYNKAFLASYGAYYTPHGYVVAVQDVRGRFASEGAWDPFIHEARDGYDTVEWLAAQPWSTGKVGMLGGSYSGTAQFLAALERPPHLAALVPNITPAMPFDNIPYDGGALRLGWAIRWADLVENARTGQEFQQKLTAGLHDDWAARLSGLPVIDLDRHVVGKSVPYWRDWVRHDTSDDYWEPMEYLDALAELQVPVLIQSGWFDPGTRGSRLAFERLSESPNPAVHLIVGPWSHSDRGGRLLEGQDMGPEADVDLYDLYRRWFDRTLKGIDNGVTEEPRVKLYQMGANRWLEADTYPLPGTVPRSYYLHAAPDFADRHLDGLLRPVLPSVPSTPDTYTYDPAFPTPSFDAYLKRNQLAQYRRIIASRDDRLIYETEALDAPLSIAGPISVHLFAATSAPDTDWFATLYGINPKEQPYPIGMTFGMVRARHQHSRSGLQSPKPGRIHEYTIDLAHTALTIPAGHRLHLEIASASFPEYSRNLNTGGRNELDSVYVRAHQKIHRGPDYPSRLVLPVIDDTAP